MRRSAALAVLALLLAVPAAAQTDHAALAERALNGTSCPASSA